MNLTFNTVRHEYRLDGHVVPSVTQLLKPLQDFSGIPKSVLERKAALGTAVHRATELLDDGTLDDETVDHRVRPYLDAYIKFKAEKKPIVLANEKQLGHPTLRYAGTLDRVLEIDGWPWLIDIKSSVTLHPWVGIQLAGYEALIEVSEIKPKKPLVRGALKLKPDGTYVLERYQDAGDLPTFYSLINLHSWRMRHAA